MTTLHTIEYYKKNEQSFFGKRGVIDFTEELTHMLANLQKESFTNEQWLIITNTFAKQVADRNTTILLKEKELYDKVRKDSNCLGYTSAFQTTQEAYRIITTFEYNCYKLKQFKEQYNL